MNRLPQLLLAHGDCLPSRGPLRGESFFQGTTVLLRSNVKLLRPVPGDDECDAPRALPTSHVKTLPVLLEVRAVFGEDPAMVNGIQLQRTKQLAAARAQNGSQRLVHVSGSLQIFQVKRHHLQVLSERLVGGPLLGRLVEDPSQAGDHV